MPSIFFTGFPGFLGSELLPRVLARAAGHDALCLVQPKFADLARERAAALMSATPALRGRIRLVEGDIAQPGLGIRTGEVMQREVTEIFHLAAIYDLSVRRELAERVNVRGTLHLLDWAAACPRLARVQYVSTCYVSGRYDGVFYEDDLEKGQRFNNFYEETKFLAECEVRARMEQGLPVTIYRPAIVVGDSTSGATQKYDGPYFAIQWLLRQPRVAVMPVVGEPSRTRLNVVPRDFVIDAIGYLSSQTAALGRVYQLADPEPLTIDALLDVLGRAMHKHIVRVPFPLALAKGALDHVPGVYRLLRIPASSIDYFAHPTRYDTAHTRTDLAGTGIEVPRFTDYAQTLVDFARAHREIGALAMA